MSPEYSQVLIRFTCRALCGQGLPGDICCHEDASMENDIVFFKLSIFGAFTRRADGLPLMIAERVLAGDSKIIKKFWFHAFTGMTECCRCRERFNIENLSEKISSINSLMVVDRLRRVSPVSSQDDNAFPLQKKIVLQVSHTIHRSRTCRIDQQH